MAKHFQIRFSATFFKHSHSSPPRNDLPVSLLVLAILLLFLMLLCRTISSVLHFCGLNLFARLFDTTLVMEVLTDKLNRNLSTKSQNGSSTRLVRSGQLEDSESFHSGGRHTRQERLISISSGITTNPSESDKTSYEPKVACAPDVEIEKKDKNTSPSDVTNTKDRRTLNNNTHKPHEGNSPRWLLPSPLVESPFPDPFSLTALERAELIDRTRRESSSDSPQHESWCGNRNHTRRRCCSPTPVTDLMEKAEKLLGDKVRPFEPLKAPGSPLKSAVGSSKSSSIEHKPVEEPLTTLYRQTQFKIISDPRKLLITPKAKAHATVGLAGGYFDGCNDLQPTADTAANRLRPRLMAAYTLPLRD